MKKLKIFYAINGDGRGHAGRSLAIIERLNQLENDVEVFTSNQAYELLKDKGFKIHNIPSVSFAIENNKVNLIKTAWRLFLFLFTNYKNWIKYVKDNKPDIIITDFEPLFSRIAKKLNIKLISIDNQHKFFIPLPKHFPLKLKLYQFFAKHFVRFFIKKPKLKLITTFHYVQAEENLHFVGPIIRADLKNIKPNLQDFILVYPQNPTQNFILPVLSKLKSENFIIFSKDRTIQSKNFEYRDIDSVDFAQCMANCKAIICSAGNQTICEASYYNKKCLAVPVPGQLEQEINARYVKEENLGDFCFCEKLTKDIVINFLRSKFKKEPKNCNSTSSFDFAGFKMDY